MPDTIEWDEQRKQAMSLLNVQIQAHERYHTQKENLTWLIDVAYLSATVLLVGREPFWKTWPPTGLSLWLTLLVVTAVAVLTFLHSQFQDRHRASAFFVAVSDVATTWIAEPPRHDDLQPRPLQELSGMLVPTAVEARFRDVFHAKSSLPQRVTFALVVVWSFAALSYVIAMYSGCKCS